MDKMDPSVTNILGKIMERLDNLEAKVQSGERTIVGSLRTSHREMSDLVKGLSGRAGQGPEDDKVDDSPTQSCSSHRTSSAGQSDQKQLEVASNTNARQLAKLQREHDKAKATITHLQGQKANLEALLNQANVKIRQMEAERRISGEGPTIKKKVKMEGGPTAEEQERANIQLFQSVEEGNVAKIKSALDLGADINCLLEKGFSSRREGNASYFYEEKSTPLHVASGQGHTDAVRYLLAQGSDIRARDWLGREPLHLSSHQGRTEVVKLLLENRANVHSSENCGWTALHLASMKGHNDVIGILLDKGAKINCVDQYMGQTALHHASSSGRTCTVNLLLQRGAKSIRDVNGKTAFGRASEMYPNRREEVQSVFKKFKIY